MSYYSVTKIHNDINKDHLKIKFNNMEETSDYINITIKNVLNKIKKKFLYVVMTGIILKK